MTSHRIPLNLGEEEARQLYSDWSIKKFSAEDEAF